MICMPGTEKKLIEENRKYRKYQEVCSETKEPTMCFGKYNYIFSIKALCLVYFSLPFRLIRSVVWTIYREFKLSFNDDMIADYLDILDFNWEIIREKE